MSALPVITATTRTHFLAPNLNCVLQKNHAYLFVLPHILFTSFENEVQQPEKATQTGRSQDYSFSFPLFFFFFLNFIPPKVSPCTGISVFHQLQYSLLWVCARKPVSTSLEQHLAF